MLLAGVVAGCGTQAAAGHGTASSPASASASASAVSVTQTPQPSAAGTSPAPGGSGVLTVADNGRTIRVAAGHSVTVVLGRNGLAWHIPAASSTVLRRTSASGGYPGRAPARATFLAVRPGRAQLSAADDAACLHAQPACMLPQRAWVVSVVVTAS